MVCTCWEVFLARQICRSGLIGNPGHTGCPLRMGQCQQIKPGEWTYWIPCLETVKDGVWLLCMQACWWRGAPSCSHPMGCTFDALLQQVNLHWKECLCTLAQLGHALVPEMSFRMSGQLNLATPQLELRAKWLDLNPLAVNRTQGWWGP